MHHLTYIDCLVNCIILMIMNCKYVNPYVNQYDLNMYNIYKVVFKYDLNIHDIHKCCFINIKHYF